MGFNIGLYVRHRGKLLAVNGQNDIVSFYSGLVCRQIFYYFQNCNLLAGKHGIFRNVANISYRYRQANAIADR